MQSEKAQSGRVVVLSAIGVLLATGAFRCPGSEPQTIAANGAASASSGTGAAGGAGGEGGGGGAGAAGAGGDGAAAGAGGDEECGPGITLCGSSCVDTSLDPSHCGGCDEACAPGEVCSAGTCALACAGGTTDCGGSCVDLQTSWKHCGGCDEACALGEVCSEGQCALSCGGGTTQCGDVCADTQTDPKNCGACGEACAPGEVCAGGACAGLCDGGLIQCGNACVDTQTDPNNCGGCGNACEPGATCAKGSCAFCDGSKEDCDGDGWLVAEGDCCDAPGPCPAPELVNPGAIEIVGNGVDDNCNGATDLFDIPDTVPCDGGLAPGSGNPVDYAKALGICRQTVENPASKKDETWGLIEAKILRADGSPLSDPRARSIRTAFGAVSPASTEGQAVVVLSTGIAADGKQQDPGPNGGAPAGMNVSTAHEPPSAVDITAGGAHSVKDWYGTANPPLKPAKGLPDSPGCNAIDVPTAHDSVMLVLRLRAPTNMKAFSLNANVLSAEYPEYVCTQYNDQFVVLVDTPGGVPSPIPNPVDKNLTTYTSGGEQWPIGINIAKGTSLFSVCEPKAQNPGCWDDDVSLASCTLGAAQLAGTGFEMPDTGDCPIGGGTFWLTTAGNVVPGGLVELRIAIWDVSDNGYDSIVLLDGFEWLPSPAQPGTNN